MTAGPGAFDRMASFALDRDAETFPDAVLCRASLLFLDTLGVAIAASPMEAGRIARDVAALHFCAGDEVSATPMLFDGRKVSVAGAAYAAATQIDNLDGHDGYNPTKGHVGVVVAPVLAILAGKLPHLTGREALAAIAVAYEVAGRAAIALHATVSDYHTSGAWNALGVVALAARLRDLDRRQLREALGIAEYHGPRSQMMREIATPTMLHDGAGWGALAGITAVTLAERGFTGAPAITVEAPEVARHWDDLGEFWQILHHYVKPYPVCRWAHAAIDATRGLILAHDLVPAQIASIEVNSFHHAACLFGGLPETTSRAQYSLAFAVAVMAVHRRIGVEHISGAGLTDPNVARFLDRVTVKESVRHSSRFPLGRWADVIIRVHDGRALASGDVHARGGPEAPFSADDIIAKFMEFAGPVLGEERASAIRDHVLALIGPNGRFADLAPFIFEPAALRKDIPCTSRVASSPRS